jgi:hypothetical protein
MKLRDLDAHFLGQCTERGFTRQDSIEGAQGVMFQCPSCGAGKEQGEEDGRRFIRGAHYIRVCFSNPRGASVAPDAVAGGKPRWELVSGTSLNDLTLSPSINCDIPWRDDAGVEHASSCKFHGYVRNGDAS